MGKVQFEGPHAGGLHNNILQKYTNSPTSHDVLTLLSAQSLSDSNFPEAARYSWPGNEAKGRKTCGRGVKRTQILAMGCSTRKPALWQGSPVCRRNGR